ncbi:MAG: prepilin-type N-terminal cleavage/methylation domain-containing protein [Oscillospiraceae bacterium]|nr:prepilin-type N-terminal cleavage/methylation domain-containing protein [Oscillospiraceae bacterium]
MFKSSSSGFTLIECILVMFIIITIMSISIPVLSRYRKVTSAKELDMVCENIIYYINTGKMYVKNKKLSDGKLVLLQDKSGVLISGTNLARTYKLPKNMKIEPLTGNYSRAISYEGFINEGCTWVVSDDYGNSRQIVILVGTGYAEIK